MLVIDSATVIQMSIRNERGTKVVYWSFHSSSSIRLYIPWVLLIKRFDVFVFRVPKAVNTTTLDNVVSPRLLRGV